MKIRALKQINELIKNTEVISLLAAENKKLVKENRELRGLLKEGLALIEKLEKLR